MSTAEPMVTTYRMTLCEDLERRTDLERYAGAYGMMSIEDAGVGLDSNNKTTLWFKVAHPHSEKDIAEFCDYLNRYYQRTDA
jgi:hypothetical protein